MSEERPEVSAAGENPTEPEKKTILIGSQRDPETRKAGQAPLRTYDQMAANAPVVTREEIARRAAAKGTARNNDQPDGGDAQKPPRPP
ncbi:MAG: hypothetical protein IKF77_07255, partial [Thermoguttaceae bacterium]|nr:hypothetical protein [Thermoguttaceae bacterium]